MSPQVRLPAVAGTFYPEAPAALHAAVQQLLAQAEPPPEEGPCPKALIVPHAGYVYSGPIAASAFARLLPHSDRIRRVILLGPAHRVRLDGLAAPGAAVLRTPLGDIAVDEEALLRAPGVVESPAAHEEEHCLEVELPFLQEVAPWASVVPLVVGRADAAEVGRVLEALWGGPETVIVISSDLSHYLPYDDGRAEDSRTAARVLALDEDPLGGEEACGAAAINGLLWAARRRGLHVELVDLRSSGDTAGPRDSVVGYGAFALYAGEETS